MTTDYKSFQSFEAWMKASFERSELKDIAEHGADAGWSHLTYYKDTVALYEHFKDDIWTMLLEDSEEMGFKTPYELMAQFGGAKNVGDYTTHANLLTWYAAERASQRLSSFAQAFGQEQDEPEKGQQR